MKKFSIFFLLLLATAALQAQKTAARDTLFPYNFKVLTLDSTEIGTTAAFRPNGKPTVVAFWLTTCIPCHHELAAYTEKYADWKKQADFNMFAVSTDFPQRFRRVVEMTQEKKFPFPVFWDRDRMFSTLLPGELNGLPQVFIFDKNGRIAYHHKRYRPGDENELFAKILELQ